MRPDPHPVASSATSRTTQEGSEEAEGPAGFKQVLRGKREGGKEQGSRDRGSGGKGRKDVPR
eukprot:2659589-Rhodomonas_salina.1